MEKKFNWGLSSATLHVLAMAFMLCDHLWATVVPGNEWLTCIGRLAFPIFAFMIVEGYFHTGDVKKYAKRLLVFACISEIPFNLMISSALAFPVHQNVLWTLLLGLLLVHINEIARKQNKLWLTVLAGGVTVVSGFVAGYLAMVDYYGAGVVTVLMFYFLHQRRWWSFAGQVIVLYYLNVEILGGLYYEVNLFGTTFNIVQQGLALLALVPIWLYSGRQGHSSKMFKWFCYWFYPVHMLVLAMIFMAS